MTWYKQHIIHDKQHISLTKPVRALQSIFCCMLEDWMYKWKDTKGMAKKSDPTEWPHMWLEKSLWRQKTIIALKGLNELCQDYLSFKVWDQVRYILGCTAIKDGHRLEMSDLRS